MTTIETAAALLDHILSTQGLKNDAALSRWFGVPPPVISKLRSGRLPFGAFYILRLHELTNWSIKDIKSRLPDQKAAEAVEAG